MCAALRPLQACPLSGGKFRFPSRAIPCPNRCLCRPGWACFSFSAFLLPVCSPSCVEGMAFLLIRFAGAPDSSTTGPHAPNRVCEELPWCPFPYPARKIAHRPSQGRVWFHRHFPSLLGGSPANSRYAYTTISPALNPQDENLIGKKRFSLPWLSLCKSSSFFQPASFLFFEFRFAKPFLCLLHRKF